MAFAITNGNFGSASTWDTNVVPIDGEDAYANGLTVQVDNNQTVSRVRNDASDYYLPNTSIPLIWGSNTTPSGTVIVSGEVTNGQGWRAFDRMNSTAWQSNVINTGWLGYMFPSGKIIKRYSIFTYSSSTLHPRTWTFEGSNDGSSWIVLDTQTLVTLSNSTFYTYPVTNNTSYTYYRINITATINAGANPAIAEFEMTESTSSVIGKVVGGSFNLTNGSNLTFTNTSNGVVCSALTPVILFSLNSPNNATINGNITPNSGGGQIAVVHSGNGTLTAIGTHINQSAASGLFRLTGTGVLNIVGNPSSNSSAISPTYDITGVATLNITGNVTSNGSYCIYSRTSATINITGNITSGAIAPIGLIGGGILNVVGNVTSFSTISCIVNITNAANINVTGTVTAGTNAPAIVGLGLVRITGNLINTNRFMAIYASQVTIDTTTNSWRFQQFAGGDITLYASGASLGNPAQADVRFGTTYGATNEFTGTLRVPNPNTVLLGNLTDATVGTYLPSSPADFVSELNTSTASVAVRLRNCATVATTGDQIASYGV